MFGGDDPEPEEEFMLLREILFAEMERPKEYVSGGQGGEITVQQVMTAAMICE